MLARYGDEDPVDQLTDHDDLVALLVGYDAILDGQSKIGPDIDSFFRRRNKFEGYSTPGFWVRRSDQSETDFSYISAVKGQPKTDAQEFHDACRAVVYGDLLVAKKQHFNRYGDDFGRVPCDLTDQLITFDEAHLDYAYLTFGQLVVSFRASRNWQHAIPKGVLSDPADGQTTTTFVDADVAKAFRDFHHGAARLRIISKDRNLAMAAGQRCPKLKRQVQIP
jgi:hypothetical protein